MSRKKKGCRNVVHATVTKRSEAPQITTEAEAALVAEVAQKDAEKHATTVWAEAMRRRDYADKSAYRQGTPAPRILSTVEEPAKYLAPPKLAPLNPPIPNSEPDFSLTAIGVLLTGMLILGIGIGKLLA